MKNRSYKIIALCLTSLIFLNLKAENEGKSLYTFERIATLYPWLSSNNAAGLVFKDFRDFSQVAGRVEGYSGTDRNYNQPEMNLSLSGLTRSYVSYGDFFFYGSFNFTHFERRNQAWLGTIYPNSVINMMTDSIPGRILGESYRISGAAGYKINQSLATGVGFDYETATAAKRTDGRNKNILSSVELRPSLIFQTNNLIIGANLLYRYNAERVEYAFLGNFSGKHLYNFQGGWMYMKEGITTSTDLNRGYFSDSFGAAIQASYSADRVNLFGELDVEYGLGNNYDDNNLLRRYSLEEGLQYNFKGRVDYNSDNLRHSFTVNAIILERLSYKIENIYEPVQNESNTWNWFEYGKTLRYYDRTENFKGLYAVEIGGSKWNPKWRFSLTGNFVRFSSEFIVYPSKYIQDYYTGGGEISAMRNLKAGKKSLLDITILGGLYKGGGEMLSEENPFLTGNLYMSDNLLEEDFLFKTSKRYLYGGRISYRYSLNEKKGTTLFLDATIRQYQRKGLSKSIISVNLGLKF